MSDAPNQAGDNGKGPGYEVRDANIKVLLQFGFWLAVILVVTLLGMRLTYSYLIKATPLGSLSSPFQSVQQVPPGPLLQAHPHQDLTSFCAEQVGQVDSYAWINQAGGIVQIPVDQAMNIVLQRGLPSRSAEEMAAGGGTIPPVGSAGEPDASYEQGPCGYLQVPAAVAQVPKD